jgi:hypothetical protein
MPFWTGLRMPTERELLVGFCDLAHAGLVAFPAEAAGAGLAALRAVQSG